jgi:hypothetical protein
MPGGRSRPGADPGRAAAPVGPGRAAASEAEAGGLAARTLALPDAQSAEDLTALLTSAGER